MKLRIIFVAMAVFMLASVSHAQFNAGLYNFGPNLLMNSCTGGEPLGPDCVVRIYWDANNNGPDASDQQPAVGDGFGEANYNSFTLQSGYDFGTPGGFYVDPTFTISTLTPLPSRYYLVCDCGGVKWTSSVITILNGLNDYDMGALPWTCETTVVPCNGPTNINVETVGGHHFLPDGAVYTNCFNACAGTVVTICLGPLRIDEQPISGFGECQGTPAAFQVTPAGWVYNSGTSEWCLQLVIESDGCICFRLDDILPAEHGGIDAVARDNSVVLNWSTLSENSIASFSVFRKIAGHDAYDMVGNIEAANSATGSTYSFVDNGVVNGTSYEYTLETVNLDGSREAWGVVVNATPSANLAVITEYALHQNYPNPFNPSTSLVFDVVAENVVNLKVYNAMGQEVATLVNGTMNAGRHTVSFDATNLTSGLYFYTVKIGNEFTATKKMLLVK
ncbi:MAG: T9SS type A sorting domain-containing protein [bacterium]|nr:T9SS type A sorting domain-containing protein [bacterium]